MEVSDRDLRVLIRRALLSEVGAGVGMDPTGATMPRGMERSEYGQLGDARITLQQILAVSSLIDPTILSDSLSAALYALDGEYGIAAQVMLWSAGGIGAGAAAGALFKSLKAMGKSADEAASLVDNVKDAARRIETPSSAPDPHPEIFRKYEAPVAADVGRTRTRVAVSSPGGSPRTSSIVDELLHLERMKNIIPTHVPTVRGIGGVSGSRYLELDMIPDSRQIGDVFDDGLVKALDDTLSAQDVDTLKRVREQILDIRQSFNSSQFTHGDLHMGNVLVDNKGHVWVIDPAGLAPGEFRVGRYGADSFHFTEMINSIDEIIRMTGS